ncbi:MAG: hypothetical protein IJ131_09185 [Eggerthellaceae bacterium]|nr:hypothetical protein [Eggerthellaceae bacterium]
MPAQQAYAADSFDYRTLIPHGSETAANLESMKVSFNGTSWYLTDYAEDSGIVTLLASGQIATGRFDPKSSDYKGSEIQAYLDGLTAEGGSYAAVAPAIVDVDLTDVGVEGAKLYLLSEADLNKLPENIRRISAGSGWKNYWLRTKGPNTWTGTPQAKNCYPAAVTGSPLVGEAVVTDTSKLIRPALMLDLNNVDFDEEAQAFTLKEVVSKTLTFKVANGAWSDGTDGDKTVTLTGYPGDLKLAAEDIPAVGDNPSSGYKAGSWDVEPSTDALITEDTTYIYTYAEKESISYVVTFKVENGSWNDGTSESIDVTLTGVEGDELKLAAGDIPAVGEKPAAGFVEGSWDVEPSTATVINQNRSYTYTFEEDGKVAATVTFAVKNGSWGDKTKADKTVSLEGTTDAKPKLTADQIPAVGDNPDEGFKTGSWDTTPSTETEIAEDTTYTYTYAAKDPISATVTFKVVNGAWDDGKAEDKTVTLEGLEGDQLKLTEDDIPAVGKKPSEGFRAGAWDADPDTETALTEDTTYTYTFVAREVADDIKDLIPTTDDSMEDVLAKRVNFNGFTWYVVGYDDDENTATLFASDKIGDNSRFSALTNRYGTSDVKKALDAMAAEGGLFEGASYNIKKTDLLDVNPVVEGADLFLLSSDEAAAGPVNARKSGFDYWLRSQSTTWGDGGAAQVKADGTVGSAAPNTSSVQFAKAVRPALKIDLGKTEFDKDTQTFKTKQSVTPPTAAQGLAYFSVEEQQELLSSPVTVVRGNDAEGAVLYSLDGATWSTDIPTAAIPGDYTVYYKVEGNDAYDEFVCAEPITVTIAKGDPESLNFVTATYGQTLADAKYSFMYPIPEGWSWVDPLTTPVGDVGEHVFLANYTSSDPYINSLTNVPVTVYVGKAYQETPDAPTLKEAAPTSITLNTIENGEYKCGNGEWQTSPTFTGLDPDTEYTFIQRIAEDDNYYSSSDSQSAVFRTAPNVALKSVTASDQTYTGKALTPDVVVTDANEKTVPSDAYIVEYANNIEVGTAKVTVTAKDNSGYTGTVETTFRISPDPAAQLSIVNGSAPQWVKGQPAVFTVSVEGLLPGETVDTWTWEYASDGSSWKRTGAKYEADGAKCSLEISSCTEARKPPMAWRCTATTSAGRTVASDGQSMVLVKEFVLAAGDVPYWIAGKPAGVTVVAEGLSEGESVTAWMWEYSKDGVSWKRTGAQYSASSDECTLTIPECTEARKPPMAWRCTAATDRGRMAVSEGQSLYVPDPLSVKATGEFAWVKGKPVTISAQVAGLAIGEKVVDYTWYYSKDGTTFKKTGAASRQAGNVLYLTIPVCTEARKAPMAWRVQVTTSDGRTATSDGISLVG